TFATAPPERFLYAAEIRTITRRNDRLRNQATKGQEPIEVPGPDATDGDPKPAKAPTGSGRPRSGSKPAKAPTGSEEGGGHSKPAKAPTGSDEDPKPEPDR